jgi:tetratricopeptide (TPR) repeat protein
MTRRTVMISSTALDLPEHRGGLRDACDRAGFEPHMMEKLPALDANAIEASLRIVDEADVYLGVFAYRYGYIPDGQELSITEMEYNRAVALDKPRLIFFIHEDHPVTGRDVETGPGASKLRAFKDRIGKERVAAFFKSPGDPKGDILAALITLGKKLDTAAAGGDVVASTVAKLHRKTSIPAAPEPYIAHPYTLLQSRDLVGRQHELNALTDWVAKPGSPAFEARIFCFVAIGGMGKSALTWKWFNQIAPNEMKPLAGRMWWSFYESDATFENFLIRALGYVSGQSEEEVRALPWQEREAQLLQCLNEKPFLLALDGLERILIAYNRVDASSLADDDFDKQTANIMAGVAGLPATTAQSFVGEHRLRQTTDPRAGAFLRKLAQTSRSRTLISSRLYPSELQLPTLHPRPGCFAIFLKGLTDDDALSLWRGLGVTGSRAELMPIFRSIESHPLLIQALASEVAKYRNAPGDFARWRADHPTFDPASLPLIQSRTHILQFALRGISEKIRDILSMIVGFRMPASYASLDALLVGANKSCMSAQELDQALTELEDRGLIGWDRDANRYDAHPIVRGVVWQFTEAEDQQAVYAALEAHFEPMAIPEADKVKRLADLTPAIERFHTLVSLGRLDEACHLFQARLSIATLYTLAAHRERIAWLERVFPDGVAGSPALTKKDYEAYTLNELGQSYLLTGNLSRASAALMRAVEIYTQLALDPHRQGTLSNLAETLRDSGQLRQAVGIIRQSLSLTHKLDDRHREIGCLWTLGELLSLTGDNSPGHVALTRARRMSVTRKAIQSEGLASIFLSQSYFWLDDFVNAATWADRAQLLATISNFEYDLISATLTQGRSALGLGDIARADECLHLALTRARVVSIVESELVALTALAELELKRQDKAGARARLGDVWDAAGRGPYPLRQADAYNVLAAITRAEGDDPAAIDAATKAYKAAWCDGPPYAYHWGLLKAKAHLAALGAPEPDMPPFDESKFEPLPEIEINPRDEYWVDPDALD